MTPVKPLNFIQSVLFFGCSAVLFRLSVYNLMPSLQKVDVSPFWAFIISYSIPLLILTLATFFCLKQEGNLMHWRQRLRLDTPNLKQTLLCIGLFMTSFLLTGLLTPTAKYIASIPLLSPPDFLPSILNPNKTIPGQPLTNFMGVPLKGTYWIIPVYFVFLTFFNILAEELWFRGYLLPRQEIMWGEKTWIYHGIFWSLFHAPIYPWAVLYLLPTTLTVSFVTQKFKNTWSGFIIHYLGNGILALLPIIIGVV